METIAEGEETRRKEQEFPTSTKAEREEYLRNWAMNQRHPVTREAKAELKRRFGIGIGTDDYSRILREVDRRKAEMEAPVSQNQLDDVVRLGRALAASGVANMRVTKDGTVLAFERFEK